MQPTRVAISQLPALNTSELCVQIPPTPRVPCGQPEAAAEPQGCSREMCWVWKAQKGEQTLRSPRMVGDTVGSKPTEKHGQENKQARPTAGRGTSHTTAQPGLAVPLVTRNYDQCPFQPEVPGLIRKVFLPYRPGPFSLGLPQVSVLFWPWGPWGLLPVPKAHFQHQESIFWALTLLPTHCEILGKLLCQGPHFSSCPMQGQERRSFSFLTAPTS